MIQKELEKIQKMAETITHTHRVYITTNIIKTKSMCNLDFLIIQFENGICYGFLFQNIQYSSLWLLTYKIKTISPFLFFHSHHSFQVEKKVRWNLQGRGKNTFPKSLLHASALKYFPKFQNLFLHLSHSFFLLLCSHQYSFFISLNFL